MEVSVCISLKKERCLEIGKSGRAMFEGHKVLIFTRLHIVCVFRVLTVLYVLDIAGVF